MSFVVKESGRGGGDRTHNPKTGRRAGTLEGLMKSWSEK